MPLTYSERWMLFNQHTILSVIVTKADDRESHARMANLLRDGFELEWEMSAANLVDEDILTADQCRWVRNVLKMFDQIQASFEKHGPEAHTVSVSDTLFSGFDGNNETKELCYAEFLREDGKWSKLKCSSSDGLNSHSPMRDVYNRMLQEFQALDQFHDLTPEQVSRIIDARIHPSNRKK